MLWGSVAGLVLLLALVGVAVLLRSSRLRLAVSVMPGCFGTVEVAPAVQAEPGVELAPLPVSGAPRARQVYV